MANLNGTNKQTKPTSKEIMTTLKKKYDDVIDDGGVYTVRKKVSGDLFLKMVKNS